MEKGEKWYGRDRTPYAGVEARIETATTRNVQVSYDRIVIINGMQLTGQVIPKGRFRKMFEPDRQLELFE